MNIPFAPNKTIKDNINAGWGKTNGIRVKAERIFAKGVDLVRAYANGSANRMENIALRKACRRFWKISRIGISINFEFENNKQRGAIRKMRKKVIPINLRNVPARFCPILIHPPFRGNFQLALREGQMPPEAQYRPLRGTCNFQGEFHSGPFLRA